MIDDKPEAQSPPNSSIVVRMDFEFQLKYTGYYA